MFPCDDEGYYCADMESHYLETWDAMEALVDMGLAKSIGLSNFNRLHQDWYIVGYSRYLSVKAAIIYIFRRQLEEVCLYAKKYKPSVLQNESHPYLHEKDLRDYCRINNIVFQVQHRANIFFFIRNNLRNTLTFHFNIGQYVIV